MLKVDNFNNTWKDCENCFGSISKNDSENPTIWFTEIDKHSNGAEQIQNNIKDEAQNIGENWLDGHKLESNTLKIDSSKFKKEKGVTYIDLDIREY